MALIECPDCGRQVSDAASACPQCGRPIAALPGTAPVASAKLGPPSQASAVAEREDQPGTWRCSGCGAIGAFRKFSVIFEEGTHSISTSTSGVGVGLSGGGVGVGVAGGRTKGSQQSDLARRVAPPAPKTSQNDEELRHASTIGCLMPFVAAVLAYVAFSFSTAFWVLVVASIAGLAWIALKSNEANADLPTRTAAWQRKFLCTRCGYERERLPSVAR